MTLSERLVSVRERIEGAAGRAGQSGDEICLVAVTKTWPAETVVAAYRAGLRDFGENRAEELAQKRPEVMRALGDADDIVWHAIGALQSRKTGLVVDHADAFHALDRLKIAGRLSRQLIENGRATDRPLPVFLEVNISGEGSKAGLDCSHWETDGPQRAGLMDLASAISELPGLVGRGLMTMAPWKADEAVIRDVFRRTRELSIWLGGQVPGGNWSNLSMGMSDDFEIAIEEGATHIRVGTAIFGRRR